MRIGVVGSMNHAEKILALKNRLIEMGHEAFVTGLIDPFVGKDEKEKERIKLDQETNIDCVIKEFWDLMQGADAVLVANYEKKGIDNYIGGNTFLEMGFAHVLNQKIYLLNPVPEIEFYKAEIITMKPIILNNSLRDIK
ncbi:MAG: hypothetical protein WCT32_01745 [Patescibacteria group bacterium]|jgi:hypothetical protein